ncbi:hypothetical protein DB313_04590 (plasmid) [Borrelia turcica IST7]|uniref:DUF276 domain-containing protein n=1 Tax=Borrelia turcica IST7 TaxID=1104446 RepID=A0A386PNY2_9SPIR|nr:DUF276 domain-containing protein [Borrelia turcica]AYE36779.1 hypothetical protein DB313_04590 [Borrelia turcica IST7]
MSIFFDKEIGILTKSIDEIQSAKKEILKKEYNISIKNNSLFDIINYPSSAIDLEIIQALNELFLSLKEGGTYFKNLQKSLSVPKSSTHEAIKQALLMTGSIKYANLISTAGTIEIHIILKPESKDNVIDLETQKNIWEAIYYTAPSGTVFKGDKEVEFLNKDGQKKTYKYSLGVVKYAYLKVFYKTEAQETIYKEISEQIKQIYKKTIEKKYKDMGISFRNQDFLSPVSLMWEMKCIRIGICIKDNLDTKITEIKDSEFQFNKDLEIKDNELIAFDENSRLIIERE